MAKAKSGAEDAVLARVEALEAETEVLRERESLTEQHERKKLDWRNQIAESVEAANEARNAEFFGSEEVEQPEDEGDEVPPAPQPEDVEDDEADGSQLLTKTIRGKKVTKTVDEWIALATKVEDADTYYSEAARRVHQKPPVPEVDEAEVLREVAKKLQLGSEDEAAEAITAIIQKASTTAAAKSVEQAQAEAANAVWASFSRDYIDLVNDPVLYGAVMSWDQRLIEEGRSFDLDRVKDFDKRIRWIGDQVRNWKKEAANLTVKTEKRQQLVNKKEKIVNLNTASSKVGSSQEKQLSEKEAKSQAVADMFKARKKSAY